jgi:DNA-binding MarR family transcriptional regulator
MPTLTHIQILEQSRIRFGYRIAVLTNWYKLHPYRMFEKEYHLSESEGATLYCIGQVAGLNATDVCEITGRPKNSISRAMGQLLEKKLITRRIDVRDKRRKIVDLTPKGFAIFKRAEEWFVATESAMLSSLDKEEIQHLDAMLSKMMNNLPNWVDEYRSS